MQMGIIHNILSPGNLSVTRATIISDLLICAALLLTMILLFLPFLGELPLIYEEPRRVLIARTMMESGNYLVPTLFDEVYTAKPPLFNWLIAGIGVFAGEITAFTARLSSIIFLFFTAVVMVIGMRRYLSVAGQWLLGFAILFTPEIIAKSRLAEIEIVFTFLVTASIWSWYWLYERGCTGVKLWLLPLCIVSAAVLTKREPALAFFYLSVIAFLLTQKKFKAEFFSRGHLLSFVFMSLIIGGWLWLIVKQAGVQALLGSIHTEVLSRGMTASATDYITNSLLSPVKLLVGSLPFGLLLLPLFVARNRQLLVQRYGSLYLFCIVAILVNLPLYMLRGQTSVRYFLPMFPTMMVLVILVAETYYHNLATPQLNNLLSKMLKILSIILLMITVILLATVSMPYWPSAPQLLLSWYIILPVALMFIYVSIKLMRSAFAGSTRALVPVLIIGMLATKTLYFSLYLPYKIDRNQQQRNGLAVIQQIEKIVPQNETVQVLGHPQYEFWFYAEPGLLRDPHNHIDAGYQGYIMAEENDPAFQQVLENSQISWREATKIPYRHFTFVLGRLN